jgi:hexosaminidase
MKNTKFFYLLISIAAIACLTSCGSKPASPEAKAAFESVIPLPVSATTTGNAFFITDETVIVADSSVQEVRAIGNYLAGILRPATGFKLPVSAGGDRSAIHLMLSPGDAELGAEGYELTVSEAQVKLVANQPAGLFLGVQTLRQLLPEKIEAQERQKGPWEIATGTIRDYPEYAWRGTMLDVARHFFSVEDVKRYIDLVSYYKMNILHLHLSDDQGWRIEIKSWPNLTLVGGSTEVGGGKGGFYTQAQYSDIVAYAQSRYLTVVPEIDMPGHINAALASYAELNPGLPIKREAGGPANPAQASAQDLNAKPVPGKLYTGIQVGFSTLSAKKEITFKFVDDVLRELAAITPGPYLHIGGDEAAVTKKEDYIHFINRFKQMVNAHGKKMIGWEEIAQGDLDSSVVVQHWHSEKYAKMAAEKGAKLIFSPAKKVYLDMQYDSTTKLGLHWAAYIEADSSYIWDPSTRVEGITRAQILGVEAPLWTETIASMDDIEYMAFPRLPGVAEIGWSAARRRNWEEYKTRLGRQGKRWKNMDIDYYPSPLIQWVD